MGQDQHCRHVKKKCSGKYEFRNSSIERRRFGRPELVHRHTQCFPAFDVAYYCLERGNTHHCHGVGILQYQVAGSAFVVCRGQPTGILLVLERVIIVKHVACSLPSGGGIRVGHRRAYISYVVSHGGETRGSVVEVS